MTLTFDTEPAARDFGLDAARGLHPLDIVRAYGEDATLSTGTPEDVIAKSGDVVYPSTAVSLEILSSSTNDDGSPVGTGARTVLVRTLDEDFILSEQEVTLDGTTAVALTGTHIRFLECLVLTAGSLETNDGTLTIRVASAGATHGEVTAGAGRTHRAAWTVPNGKIAYLRGWTRHRHDQSTGGVVRFDLLAREDPDASGAWRRLRRASLRDTAGPQTVEQRFDPPLVLPGRTDVRVRADTTGTTVEVGAELDMILVDASQPADRLAASYVTMALPPGDYVLLAGETLRRPYVSAARVDMNTLQGGETPGITLKIGGRTVLVDDAASPQTLPGITFGKTGESITLVVSGASGAARAWVTFGWGSITQATGDDETGALT